MMNRNSLEEEWTIVQNVEVQQYIQSLALSTNDMISRSNDHLYYICSRRTYIGFTATFIMLASCGTMFESADCGYYSTREQALQALSNGS